MSSATEYDAIIIGGGPAGLSAALVLGRCRRRVLVYDSGRYRNQRSRALHCFLGHDGRPPQELLALARSQLAGYDNVEFARDSVERVRVRKEEFQIGTSSGQSADGRKLIIATGVEDELPRVPGLAEFFGVSVHVCPYCDGWEHRDAAIAAYGRGEKGASLARLLTQWSKDIAWCTDGEGVAPVQKATLGTLGVKVVEHPIVRLEGNDGRLHRLVFANGSSLPRQGLFFSTGQHVRSPLLQTLGCAFDENGGVVCSHEGETSVEGVYVAGDVSRDVQLAVIAAAEGARAALAVNKALLRSG
ncbi:MAG: NAD(P)/FAD-dependent oxidoreductase [Bacteroidota bacterium]|jgi:thioredoxin reductase